MAAIPTETVLPGATRRHDETPTGPPPETQVEGSTPQTLEEVLRFDITPTWIVEHWPRVSTGLSELDLQGYRVALVTGTGDSDLAGSLTYYFNKKKEVERIIFHGASGDPRRLVALVTSRYELKQQKSDDPALTLFQRTWFGKSVSELRIRPAAVVRSDTPHARYEIELAIQAAVAHDGELLRSGTSDVGSVESGTRKCHSPGRWADCGGRQFEFGDRSWSGDQFGNTAPSARHPVPALRRLERGRRRGAGRVGASSKSGSKSGSCARAGRRWRICRLARTVAWGPAAGGRGGPPANVTAVRDSWSRA